MKKPVRLAATATLLVLSAAAPVRSETPSSDEAMAEIATALTRIAAALERQLNSERLDMVMRRLDLSQRRLDQVDSQLRSALREIEDHNQNLLRSERELARLDDEEVAQLLGWDSIRLESHREEMELGLEAGRRRTAELEALVLRLEGDRARLRTEVEDWQEFLDREITDLQ